MFNTRKRTRTSLGLLGCATALLSAVTGSRAQQPASKGQPDAAKPTVRQPLPATVIEVSGTVEWARPGVSPLESKGWNAVKVDQGLEPKTQIRTGIRSYVNLQFGETTTIAIRSATHASIDDIFRSADTEHVDIGLGYGTVRGGSVEGTIRSRVTVDSPVATLAKRGTEGWEMHVEPMTGRFRISLAQHGLVEAIKKLQGQRVASRNVRPGEYATDRNIANLWIKQDIFDRNVQFYQADAVSVADADFTALNHRGLGVTEPGGGFELSTTAGRNNRDFVLDQIAGNFPGQDLPPTTVLVPEPIRRPDGNFGTGVTFRVLVPETVKAAARATIGPGRVPGRRWPRRRLHGIRRPTAE